ncbi:MAG: cardiolipin synthase ClsB [Rubrivivax sp.]|nr:cardiolipin synthase ClsB [Rubrivivax sp.]
MKPHWVAGNQFELLENGEAFYPRVFAAIAAARSEVLLETFILFDDPVGRELRTALLAAARRGVRVEVLVDGWGSPDLDEDFLRALLDAGVRWRVFEPALRCFGWRLNAFRRMHRKLVVVDAEIAFVGGINYSADHLASFGALAKQDYAVLLKGPVVAQVHAFCRQQARTGPRESLWTRWLQHRRARRVRAGEQGWAAFVVRDNGLHRHDIERQYRLALRSARSHVIIANAYFFPGHRLLREMRRAATRGVRVELILQGRPDMPIVKVAASLLHAQLIRSGVRIFEYCERPLHGKVAVVDGEWATVGSSNLDPLSLGLNLEANVLIRDRDFALGLQARLRELVVHRCREVELAMPSPSTLWWSRWNHALLYRLLHWWPRWLHALPAQQAVIQPLRDLP